MKEDKWNKVIALLLEKEIQISKNQITIVIFILFAFFLSFTDGLFKNT